MAETVLSRDQITRIAQAIATEAVIGVFVRDGSVDNEQVRAWIGGVLADHSEDQESQIIARAMFFAQRMTGGGGSTRVENFI